MSMTNLREFNLKELEAELDLPKFRVKQIYHWIHKKRAKSFDEMTSLPMDLRDEISKKYSISTPKVVKMAESKDKSVKYLLELEDGNNIETVHMSDPYGRITVCVSSQIGCPFGCSFCATGKMGLIRNLTTSEILSQIYLSGNVNNIVFMGMGEPFLNYDAVMKAVYILNSKDGLEIGARKITISTVGIPDGIKRLALEPIQVRLAVSLNSAEDRVRSSIMPVNQKYPLAELRSAIVDYQEKTGRRITFEYVMLKDINDTKDALSSLMRFSSGLDVNINLIPFNVHDEKFASSTPYTISEFIRILKKSGFEAVKRASHGADIAAACGQLATYR